MVKRKRSPKSPCGCQVDSFWRIIASGDGRVNGVLPYSSFARLLSATPEQAQTPAYDPQLKEWFLHEDDCFPDEAVGDLICLVCDQPTRGVVALRDDIDEVSLHRIEAGLDPEWHFVWA